MRIRRSPHSWSVTSRQAADIQRALAPRIIQKGTLKQLRLAAGADLAFDADGTVCIAGVVVWDVRERRVVEQHVVQRAVRFPYVPGLLSFREAPAIVAALRRLRCEPDVFFFDGQGVAHPRRFGLASHVGFWIDRPSVGCAKSLLIGECQTPGSSRGSKATLWDKNQNVGIALRTRDGVKPLYVSIGHRVSLKCAADIVLRCCNGFRLPEPTRLADRLVAAQKSRGTMIEG